MSEGIWVFDLPYPDVTRFLCSQAAERLEAIVAEPAFKVGLAHRTADMTKLYIIDCK